jgi:hypothetical protein
MNLTHESLEIRVMQNGGQHRQDENEGHAILDEFIH